MKVINGEKLTMAFIFFLFIFVKLTAVIVEVMQLDYESEIRCYIPVLGEWVITNTKTMYQAVKELNAEINRIGLLDVHYFTVIINKYLNEEHKIDCTEGPICHVDTVGFFAKDSEDQVFSLSLCAEEINKETGFYLVLDCDYVEVLA